jgi:hypothetical protein
MQREEKEKEIRKGIGSLQALPKAADKGYKRPPTPSPHNNSNNNNGNKA